MKIFKQKKIWITWEDHRRSQELAKAFNARLLYTHSKLPAGFSHFVNIFNTVRIINKAKPQILFVQNPSIFLAAVAGWLKKIYHYKLIVDRHTNFRIGKGMSLDPRILIHTILSLNSLKNADITIVTNKFLKTIVQRRGGRAFVLPDKIPNLDKKDICPVKGRKKVVYICTFADDEPFLDVIKAANEIPSDIYIYITGNHKKHIGKLPKEIPHNLIFTGFLPEQEYIDLLFAADVIMDFTTLDWCLVCGGYEAMGVGKPFITSKTKALMDFYTLGTLFAEHYSTDIANAIETAIHNKDKMIKDIVMLKELKEAYWHVKFRILQSLMRENI